MLAERLADEIYRVYQSGKNGIVLEMEHKQEWESMLKYLKRKYFNGKAIYEIRYGGKVKDNTGVFAPSLYMYLNIPRQIHDREFHLENVHPAHYIPLALNKLSSHADVGAVVIPFYHLLPEDSKRNILLALLRLLNTGQGGKLFILIVDDLKKLPASLFPYIHIIHSQKPDAEEIEEKVQEIADTKKLMISQSLLQEIVSYLQGFQCYEMDYLFSMALQIYGKEAFDEDKKYILDLISAEKVKMLERGQLLEWKMIRNVEMANMENLTAHLQESGRVMRALEEAVKNGVDIPKGILIMGLPGTGKSLFAQYAAAVLRMPLIRLEMGRMMGSHVGDSERNLREAQRQAEAMSPCILWIDEIEKGFAGSGNQTPENSGYLQRMTGAFLTWLQEKDHSCYIIATANNIAGLPPEFFRKGRFDECFYTSMPSEQELKEILRVHILKPTRAHVQPVMEEAINHLMRHAAAEKKFMTGADASTLVSNVFRRLYLDFQEQSDFSNKHEYDCEKLQTTMIHEFDKLKVFSQTNAKEIAAYDKIIKEFNFVSASLTRYSGSKYDGRLEAFISKYKEAFNS